MAKKSMAHEAEGVMGDRLMPARPMMAGDKSWARTPGTYIAGRAHIDGADETAAAMEARWGCDRLRLLVGPELWERFDRQRYLFNQAVWHGQLEDVRQQAGRMVKAWMALNAEARQNGSQPLAATRWEVTLADGTVAAIVQNNAQAHAAVESEGRHVAIYTLEEIGRLLSNYPDIAKAKMVFPGATVTEIRKSVDDPLDACTDTDTDLNDPLGF